MVLLLSFLLRFVTLQKSYVRKRFLHWPMDKQRALTLTDMRRCARMCAMTVISWRHKAPCKPRAWWRTSGTQSKNLLAKRNDVLRGIQFCWRWKFVAAICWQFSHALIKSRQKYRCKTCLLLVLCNVCFSLKRVTEFYFCNCDNVFLLLQICFRDFLRSLATYNSIILQQPKLLFQKSCCLSHQSKPYSLKDSFTQCRLWSTEQCLAQTRTGFSPFAP